MERAMVLHQSISGVLGLVGCLIFTGCSSLAKGDIALDLGIKDRGVASWYGKEFHGRVAANGEVFDMTALTAAHRKLPLGSLVRVVNLVNGKQVHLRINDRGPYVAGRMLDVSHAAAVELGMVNAGTSVVHLEVVGQHSPVMPVLQGQPPVSAVNQISFGEAFEGEIEATRTRGFPSRIQNPIPIERLFPREVLYERRERRHAAIWAGDYTAHNPVPTRIWA
ncbi:septal ring lytic transglycosylase RlpA family protein [Nitrospira sp. Nam80]